MREESGPYWRAILEARWRTRLQEVTELSVTYHATADTPGGIEDRRARRLLRRAIEARQRLADTEDALSRLAAGGFGRCEQCGVPTPDALLTAAPESRYCVRCIASAGAGTIAPGIVAGRR
jgi:RNA polymerase-binding transcription factor DksA